MLCTAPTVFSGGAAATWTACGASLFATTGFCARGFGTAGFATWIGAGLVATGGGASVGAVGGAATGAGAGAGSVVGAASATGCVGLALPPSCGPHALINAPAAAKVNVASHTGVERG
jgi:hypothetical protein